MMSAESESPHALRIGDWCLSAHNQRLTGHNHSYLLSPKCYDVLAHLAEAAPGFVSCERLLDRSWGTAVVGDNSLHQVIKQLRKMLGDQSKQPRYIETIPRRGYRLKVAVAHLGEATRAQPLARNAHQDR